MVIANLSKSNTMESKFHKTQVNNILEIGSEIKEE